MVLNKKVKTFLTLIKFEHSIFALPFAYLGLFLGSDGWPKLWTLFWVTLAMIALRTAAMALNRLIDEPFDKGNPRTKMRSDWISILSRPLIWLLIAFAIGIFIMSSQHLNPLCFKLSPIPIVLVWIYPYLKRFTWGAHFFLGAVLGIAPYAGWLAATGAWAWHPFLLTISVWAWVSGFDLFYSLQDAEYDRSAKLMSFPVRFGEKKTMLATRILHGITVGSLLCLGIILSFGAIYWLGLCLVVGFLIREHWLIKKFGLSKINEAFFNMNAWVAVVIFVTTAAELIIGR